MATVKIEALGKLHEIANFDCGSAALNQWLKTTARQHQKNNTSKTFVLVEEQSPTVPQGFMTMAIRNLTPSGDLPAAMAKKLPANVAGYTLARLAVSVHAQKRGYGERLLFEAMERVCLASRLVGGFAMFVDAKDGAADSCKKYGFVELPSKPDVLVLPIASMPGFPDR
ncbi:hypothetical protein ASF61_00755 [Duganella sp. Leaf126]|uniref:GNAT family N-acetyltransferase n=1 Tax=Duganella sp. Leaf126 TaxID=1736266 RepID=UPI0006FCBA64|nr:GNAT family N-acetyltransferase [Duganella sp. Leaf126]KQQ47219.1 hypothetical protein ASF61_00755 [Duganella sp. Leaf126]